MAAPPVIRAQRGEEGLTVVEVVVALSLFALVIVGLVTSSNGGLRLVGSSKARQTATEIANATVERARSTPYEVLAMRTGETYETDPDSPDAAISGDTYDAGAGPEDLVVLADSDEAVHHWEDTVSGVAFDVYRYVTWVAVDSQPQAYKRVTVAVQWGGRAPGGGPNRVTLSTFINEDGVSWMVTGSTTSTTSSSASSTSSSTTSTTASSTCAADDTSGPMGTITVLAGTGADTGYTAVPTVTLALTASDPCGPISMEFSNDGSTYSGLEAFSTSKVWTLAGGDGTKTVWVRYADGRDNGSVASAQVQLDTSRPTTPGSFTLTRTPNRTSAVLTWTASTDSSPGVLVGYRVYRQIGSGPFENRGPSVAAPCSTTPCRWEESVAKDVTYSYYVVAYDAAGNESVPTETRAG